MHDKHSLYERKPAGVLMDHLGLFTAAPLPGPVLDVASGDCRNGIFLALHGLEVICCDVSAEALKNGKEEADRLGVSIETWRLDLEGGSNGPFPECTYGGIIVFRYLYRPLIPNIKRALKEGGIMVYETYTADQPRFGKPRNSDFLLNHGELRQWFSQWEVIYYFEGIRRDPLRAIAQIVCRKPSEMPNMPKVPLNA